MSWSKWVAWGGTLAIALAGVGTARPQTPQAAQAVTLNAPAPVGADGKPLTFDVVSIRENKDQPDPARIPIQLGPTPDGYRVRVLPLSLVLRSAYIPSQGSAYFGPAQMTGLPAWINSTRYDIDAKISAADLPRWKDPAQQPAMLRAMLQAMLIDRFKIVVHREIKELPIYELTVAKNGPKFKPSESTDLADIRQRHPGAVNAIALNGAIVAPGTAAGQQLLFGVTMPQFTTFLTMLTGRPVQDRTGLTGKYDLSYQMEIPPPPQESPTAPVPQDLSAQMFSIVHDQLGLQLKPAKGQVETLVIDHIEKPTEN
jgi:bla regulator protein BlaR1